ncbi:hypothetical protein DUI87_00032 [Hirundo rustica rustica]|uniref:Uncharacterized protein n=1 Tax=Hirundo rustica rustica TaxID=333673 RepID=A0A3M0LC67_HIRRU|nr:hypothetical protein DUI87_00032 [Hirundo rustica rustica]
MIRDQEGQDPEERGSTGKSRNWGWIPTPLLSPQPSGVFSRLGDALDGAEPGEPEALPYAGVLKKRRECSGSSQEAQDGAVSSSVSGEFRPAWGCGKVSSSCDPRAAGSVFRRLGRKETGLIPAPGIRRERCWD